MAEAANDYTGKLWRHDPDAAEIELKGFLMKVGGDWIQFSGHPDPRGGGYLLSGRVVAREDERILPPRRRR